MKSFREFTREMLFVLLDENDDYRAYCFKTNIVDDSDDEFLESEEFEDFMDKMETSSAKWSGVHDGTGGKGWFGYHSYEIEDFNTAIKMWYKFFSMNNKLDKDSNIFVVDGDSFQDFERDKISFDELIARFSKQDMNKVDLRGREFVFTGFRDAELKNFIESCGGVVKDGITKKTTDLLTKDFDSNSTKAKKAKEIGAKVTQVDDFKNSLKNDQEDEQQEDQEDDQEHQKDKILKLADMLAKETNDEIKLEEDLKLYRKNEILKFFNRISKLKQVTNLKKISDLSFTFKIKGKNKYIEYNIDSECIVINDGTSLHEEDAREIAYSELNGDL